MGYGDSPVGEQMQTDWRKKILHTTVAVGNYLVQGADVTPQSYQKPQGVSVTLNIEDATEAERVFKPVSQRHRASAFAGDVLGEAVRCAD